MTIDEAIEILTQHQLGTDPLYLPKLPEAETLGIKALKLTNKLRAMGSHWARLPLPGETRE